MKMRNTIKIAAVGVGVIVIMIGWWLLKPLFVDKEVNEVLPTMAVTEQSASVTPIVTMSTEKVKPLTMKYEGAFVDGEPGHHAKGKAFTVLSGDTTILRLEDLDATNGPDLHLYLAKPGGKTSEGVNLGKLKGNIGNQNYELPPGTDLSVYSKVVIYCKQFSVDFGYSELKSM